MGWSGPKAVCDQCSYELPLRQLRKRFDGAMVCWRCWEPRHPQERLPKPPIVRPVKNPRPEPPILERDTCTQLGRTAIPGFAVPGCSIPGMAPVLDYSPPPAPTYGMSCTVDGISSIADLAVVGCAIVG